MKKIYPTLRKDCILFFIFFTALTQDIFAQTACIPTCSAVTSFTANLSSNPNNSYTVSSVRNGKCCFGTGSDACVVFYVSVHPSATEIKFFKSGGNNGSYQINCSGTMYNPTDPVCLNGLTNFCLTYCNPGGNNDTYTITTSSGFSATPNFSLRAGCSGTMSVSGLTPNSITWTSITGSVQGLYNSYLSCTSGSNCMTPIVTPTASTPSFIDYLVCGTKAGCSSGTVCDTVRVYTTPGLTVAITPTNPVICSGGPSTIALTSSVSGGASPYTYTWSNTANTSSTAVTAGSYTVNVNDATTGCSPITQTITVGAAPTPTTPSVVSNSPLCAGQALNFTTPTTGGTYTWTGPNSFTSTLQNPSISNITTAGAGTYSIFTTVGGCTSVAGTVVVTVNTSPATPTVGANSPLCALQTLSLTASNIGGATYSWSGPNGFSSISQNPTIPNVTTAAAGTYSVFATASGCSGPTGTVAVTVNPAPAAPIAGANGPLCAGQTLSLTASFTTGATYNWSGPNTFTSAIQNPIISAATPAATGLYSVSATVAGCTGPVGTISVNVSNQPSPPVAGANSPLCIGQTLSLTASFTTGITYSWSGPNGFISSLQNPTITGITLAENGTYSVFATSAGGCAGPTTTLAVTVNTVPSAPTAGANTPLCVGQTLNLTSTFTSGATYNWSGPNTFTSNVQNPTIAGITIAGSGIYSVNATVAGCTGPAGTISVTVNATPASPTAGANTPLCVGQTLNLTSTFTAGATYNWSGPNTFTSNVQNPTIAGITIAGAGIYSVNATISGCTGPIGTISVTVNPIPSQLVLTSNSPVCELQTLTFSASPNSSTYNWTGPNGFTSILQNPSISNISLLGTGSYSATQTVLGCTSSVTVINVTVNPAASTPTVTSNSPVCLGQSINLNQSTIGGATYNWSGPNAFNSTNQNPTIANASFLASGTYSVFATVAGCPGQTVTISVLVSSPGTVTSGASPTVCANNSTVTLNGSSSTGSGSWASSGSGIFSPNTLNGSYIPSNADISAGLVTLTLTSTNNGGCAPVNTTLNVQITPAPTSNAGSSQTVCANNATVSLSGSVTIASGGIWSSSGTGSFSPNNTALNPNYIPSASDISSGSFTLALTTSGNGNCIAVSNSIVISISPAPVVIPGPNPQVVCKNNPNFQLNGSSTTGSGIWASSGTGTFSTSNTILNPTYIPSTADTTAGSITLTLTSTNNGGCNMVSQTMTILYISTITVNAGSDQVVCANNSTVTLNGVSTTGAGIWTSSGTGTFSPAATLLTTNYIPSAADILAGVVTLTLTTTNNGGCNPISNAMTITITPGPTADAGPSQTVCANNATVALSGSVTIAGGGVWSSSGTGTFSPNNTTLNVNYIASSADTTAGSVIITLSTTANGNCNATTNTMVIYFSPAPLVNAGANLFVCKNNPTAILNGYSSTGSATWTTLGTGTFSPNNAISNPTYTPSTADTTAGSVMLIYTSLNNGGCNLVNDTVLITYSGVPVITAGNNQTVCANNSTVVLTGVSSTGSGTWTTSGTGIFLPNTINGNYIPSAADVSAGTITLNLTSTNNGGCNAVLGNMIVNITPAPLVNAGVNLTLCANAAAINLNGSFTISAGAQWSSSGTGTFMPNTTNMNTSYIPSSADTTAGSVMIFLSTTGNGNCLQVTDTILINFISAPFANAGGDLNLCPNAANPALNGVCTTSSVTWVTLGSGTFSPSNNILNPIYIPSVADNAAGTVTLVMTSGTVTCGSASDTLVLNFKTKPKASFNYTNSCIGSATSFTDISTSPPTGTIVSWLWQFNGDTSTVNNPAYTFSTTGNQTVVLLVSNGNCTDSISKIVFINPRPFAAFSHTVLCHDSVAFKQNASISPGGITSWSWSFGDASISLLPNPFHVYNDTGTYIVSLQVISDSNCIGNRTDTVRVKKCNNEIVIGEPAVPSGFTPNGDGVNDILFVKGGPFTSLDFRIFNEWGNQIFQSDIQSNGWDGTFKQTQQPVGKFIWTLNGELIDGRKIKMAGETILNR